MARYNSLWESRPPIEFSKPSRALCKFAEQFSTWAEKLYEAVEQDPSVVFINQAKVLLIDQYFAYYTSVSRSHQDHIGNRNGHKCIYQVFRETYFQLRTIELSLTPPMLFLPEPQQQPPPVQIPGLFIGEVLDGDEE